MSFGSLSFYRLIQQYKSQEQWFERVDIHSNDCK